MATNAAILSAVVSKWAQPIILTFAEQHLSSLPFVQAINNKVISMGWVSSSWSITKELSPIMEGLTSSLAAPILGKYLAGMDDASIPMMAHGIVDAAIDAGELSLFDGKIIVELEDLEELKKYLNWNLPIAESEKIKVKTKEE